ncbi:Trihelix transcription factor ASIL1 [Vitis vinifera]|uniref:Trihelix transcription factor ASIL1 n=1 Tax=Vitis vinifera TaxID=29760 RepID=A0A438DF72_VITVI|nr:Trihelix transcription factor ASIL1 [Vitis vinifera]
MDDTEDDARYPPNPYGVNHPQGYGSSHRPKLPVRNTSYQRRIGNQYVDEDVEDEDDEEDEEELGHEEDEDVDQNNALGQFREAPKEAEAKEPDFKLCICSTCSSAFSCGCSAPKPSFGGRNSLTDWTEHETFVLLDAWGDRFLKLGRKSLRSEEWQEVAEKVSRESRTERTDTQCRNRLDTLKKKYKKENMKSGETGGGTNKWVYFKKMDMLMSAAPRQAGLSCGLDSGEYVFMNPRVYLNRPNGLDEMRDSPGNSGSSGGEEDDSDGLPPKRKSCGQDNNEGSSFRLLANSIQKFSEIYEKIENSKRQQMVELEKMRMDFHRDLELQKRQIVERAQAEIAKIRQGDDEETEVSTENVSG